MSNVENNKNIKYRSAHLAIDIIQFICQQKAIKYLDPLFNQLVKASSSIGANLVEATGSGSKKDFINYYHIALKSSNETKYWLYLLHECNIEKEVIEKFQKETNEISKMIASAILTLKGQK